MSIKSRFWSFFILILGVCLLPSIANAEQGPEILWEDLIQSYPTSQVIEASIVVQSPDGYLYRISKTDMTPTVQMIDWSTPGPVPVYWGETYVNAALVKIKGMWVEAKGYLRQILEKIRSMMDVVGVIFLLLSTGILTYLLHSILPTFSVKWIFYPVFVFLSVGWIYLTSLWSSVIYSWVIVLLPHLMILLLRLLYQQTVGRIMKTRA